MAEEKKEVVAPEANATAAPAPKSKLKLILIALGGLLVAGGAGFFFLGGSKAEKKESADDGHSPAANSDDATAATSGEHADAKDAHAAPSAEKKDDHPKADDRGAKKDATADGHGEKKSTTDMEAEEGKELGATLTLKPFHLNLGNPLENRYVRLEVAIEFKGGDPVKAELEARTAQLRDAIISVASRKTREFLLSPDGKDQLRREMFVRVNRYLSKPVEAVYITDILVE